jgi:hypothetical protein
VFIETLRGAWKVVSPKIESNVKLSDERIVSVEFDPWIQSDDRDSIEAAKAHVAELDPV